ncbi:hypothetical protein GA0061099_1004519 [Bradyrhizobium yuanmingense]|uniref:Uncharacterized protein n=1 Tax=Bradyrhizobium yuanmingense TaxID=108015 RepID=A0A1C3VSS4_9BRAD|nr:hypothetical protein IQ15_02278 [Bradyrhizobium yuanmingense]SCB30821.1 hypothetical protein GA0061099_1004519 [Bradyrhizobium yuanmingense]
MATSASPRNSITNRSTAKSPETLIDLSGCVEGLLIVMVTGGGPGRMVDEKLIGRSHGHAISFGKPVARMSTAARTFGGSRGERGQRAWHS